MLDRAESAFADFTERRVLSVARDLSAVPNGVEALEIQSKNFKDWAAVPARRGLRRLSVYPVRAAEVELVARLPWLHALWLGEVRAESLAALAALRDLRVLALHWAPKPASLAGVSELTGLRSLTLWDVPRLAALDELAALTELRELAIETAPGRDAHGPQRFPTLAPLAALKRLERLTLTGIAARDDSLAPLHGLKSLRELRFANAFPLAEFARLAGALPQARGNFAEPVWDLHCGLRCRKCGAEKIMLLGVGTRLTCRTCDAAKIAAHVAEFERLRSGACPADA